MATGTPHQALAADAVPMSAMAMAEEAPPAAATPPSFVDRLRQRIHPVVAHGILFLVGLSGGLAVATGSSLTLHYLTRGEQLAAARIELPHQVPEPLDIEIQKAKAELDAAVAKHGS